MSETGALDTQPGEVKNNIEAAFVFNWQREETALHGYSYSILNSRSARQLLYATIAGTLFFTGEGIYEGVSPGTVEAALISGKEAAAKVRKLSR